MDGLARVRFQQGARLHVAATGEGHVVHVAFQHEVARRVVAGFSVNLVPLVAFTVGRRIGFRADGQCAQNLRGRLSNRNAPRRRSGRYGGGDGHCGQYEYAGESCAGALLNDFDPSVQRVVSFASSDGRTCSTASSERLDTTHMLMTIMPKKHPTKSPRINDAIVFSLF